MKNDERLTLVKAQEHDLGECVVSGLAIILQALNSVYFTRELAGQSKGLLNIITEKIKIDAAYILFDYWRHIFKASSDVSLDTDTVFRLLELEIARAVAEEYGELNETERIDVTVEAHPYKCLHSQLDNYDRPTIVIMVHATYLDRVSLPEEHTPLSKEEVASAGWHKVADVGNELVIDGETIQRENYRAIGLAALAHSFTQTDTTAQVTYNFSLTPEKIHAAIQRSQLPDYRNDASSADQA
jgi:hypothetical protein